MWGISFAPHLQEVVTIFSDSVETFFEGFGPPRVDSQHVRAAADFNVA